MEALLAIGGGVLAARRWMPKTGVATEEEDLGAAYALVVNEGREHGLMAPSFNSVNFRRPFGNPAYGIGASFDGDCTADATERIYQRMAGDSEEYRRKIEQQLIHDQPVMALRRGQPIVTTYTHELHNPETGACTEFQDYSWVPPYPDDGDYNRAGAMAKQIKRDPRLFTPDATYFTAPGVSWRHVL